MGLPGADLGLQEEDPTIAGLLKAQGYATGQFGKNHLGDKDEHLPTNHGFDEFFGNLYHLSAEEEPENEDYPKDPDFRKRFGPRGVIKSSPDGKIEDTGPLTRKRFERSEVKQRIIIALTDGNDTGSQVPPAEAARIAADKGIVVHTVAVSDPTAVGEEKLDEEALQNLAETTGGPYFHAADREQLKGIYADLDRLEARQVETIRYRPRLDLFHWPIGFGLVLSLLFHSVAMRSKVARRLRG